MLDHKHRAPRRFAVGYPPFPTYSASTSANSLKADLVGNGGLPAPPTFARTLLSVGSQGSATQSRDLAAGGLWITRHTHRTGTCERVCKPGSPELESREYCQDHVDDVRTGCS